jgi:hypothetical protein
MKQTAVSIILLAFSLLFSCDDEKVSRPAFQTYPVSELTGDGVTFNAKISVLGSASIVSYGFVWATHESPDLRDSTKIFNVSPPVGRFNYRVSDDLIAGEQYFVRAFVKTREELFFSNSVKFESLGSATPII